MRIAFYKHGAGVFKFKYLVRSCMCFEVGISGFDEAACEARVGFRFGLPTKRITDLYRIV